MARDVSVTEVVPLVQFHPAGTRYSQEMVDRCYQVWALKAGRSPTRTWKLLMDPKWREAVGLEFDESVPDRSTIEYWSKAYRWLERFHDDIEATGGAVLYQAKAEVILATGEAAQFLRDTVSDEAVQTKDRLKAAELLMSYGMGKDSGVQMQSKPRGESDIDPEQLKDMDTAQLIELSQRRADLRRKSG